MNIHIITKYNRFNIIQLKRLYTNVILKYINFYYSNTSFVH